MMDALSVANIERAREVIDPVFLNSPMFDCAPLSEKLGVALTLKAELFNPIRSFKGRGADYYCSTLPRGARLVCASAGNFGQGLAYAVRKRGQSATVFAALSANPLKVEAMRRFGADVRLEGDDFDAAKTAARAFSEKAGAAFVEDGAISEIAEGAGVIALEMIEADCDIDAVIIPLGNGALAAGVAHYFKAKRPNVEMICATAAGAPAMKRSLEEKRFIATPSALTIADGIAVRVPVAEALTALAPVIDHVIEVGEADIRAAMKLLADEAGLVVEPAGAAGLAAIIADEARWRGRRVATILCGGNIAPSLRAELFA